MVTGIIVRRIVAVGRATSSLMGAGRIGVGIAIRLVMARLRKLRFRREGSVITAVIRRSTGMRRIHRVRIIGVAAALEVGMVR
jgi:hypothetical protein